MDATGVFGAGAVRLWHTVRNDWVVQICGVILVGIILPFFLPILTPDQLWNFSTYYGDIFLIPICIAVFLYPVGRSGHRGEEQFWKLIAVAFGSWMAVELVYVVTPLVPIDVSPVSRDLAADCLWLIYYACLFLAVLANPHLAVGSSKADIRRRIGSLGSVVFCSGLVVCFVFIPSTVNVEEYGSWIPSDIIYAVLDSVLLISFLYLYKICGTSRWRLLYGVMALYCGTWAILDVLEVYWDRTSGWGTPWDVLWFLPHAAAILAGRLRQYSLPLDDADDAEKDTTKAPVGELGFHAPLVLYAFAFPTLHFGLYSVGLLDLASRPERETWVVGFLLILGVLALLQQRSLESERKDAEAERKKAEEALRGLNDQLEERVQARTQELTEVNAQIRHRQKLESLGVLAGGIAHDFNNLLTVILGNASLALTELPSESPARARVQAVESASERAAELTSQMLAYAGKGKFIIGPVSLNRLIREIVSLTETVINKKTTLKYALTDNLPAVEADKSQLQQVILNLVTNASEALEGEDGVVTVSTGVTESVEGDSGTDTADLRAVPYVYLRVSDTGCGMDEDIKAKMFDPFFTSKFTGRGLGLAAVAGIVRGHRGAIRIESKPGQGTTFTIDFPVSAQPAEGHHEEPASIGRRDGRGTILVVDDEEAVREIARLSLEKSGYTVLVAADGQEGVEVFREQADGIAAVLLDLSMPHMSGEEAYEKIHRIQSKTPVILTSGYSEQEAAKNLGGKGVAGFLRKPFRPVDLVEKVGAAIQGNESRKHQ